MPKSLQDLCIQCIAKKLPSLTAIHLGKKLSATHKELLLEYLVHHDMLTETRLPYITYHLFSPALTHINFYRCDQVTDKLLILLGQSGCKLAALTIHGCSNISDAGIIGIATGQNELITLELRKLLHLTGKGLRGIKSPHLEKLDLRGCSSITNAGVQTAIKNNPTIKTLMLVDCAKLEDALFVTIASHLIDLECLDVASFVTMSNTSLAIIAKNCKLLQTLIIHGCGLISANGLNEVSEHCPKLTDLNLSYCKELSKSPDCSSLGGVPQSIRALDLTGVQLEQADMLVLYVRRLHSLTELRLCGVPALADESLKSILSFIGHQLTLLDLSCSTIDSVTELGLESISDYCTSLERLYLSKIQSFRQEITGIALLPLFENADRANLMRELFLDISKSVSIEVIDAVTENCHNLEVLSVAGLKTVITDHVLMSIAKNCPKFRSIYAKGCLQITDIGVCEIARSCPVKIISLSGIQHITDKSMFALANGCPYLEEIYINGCYGVTPAAVKYLRDTCIKRVFCYHRLP